MDELKEIPSLFDNSKEELPKEKDLPLKERIVATLTDNKKRRRHNYFIIASKDVYESHSKFWKELRSKGYKVTYWLSGQHFVCVTLQSPAELNAQKNLFKNMANYEGFFPIAFLLLWLFSFAVLLSQVGPNMHVSEASSVIMNTLATLAVLTFIWDRIYFCARVPYDLRET